MNDQVEENQVTDDDWAAAMSEQAVAEPSAESAAAPTAARSSCPPRRARPAATSPSG